MVPGAGREVRTYGILVTKEEPITGSIGMPAVREQYGCVALDGEGRPVDF